MSMGDIWFTSLGSNGGCWVIVVVVALFFSEKNSVGDFRQNKINLSLFVYMRHTPNKKGHAISAKKKVQDVRVFLHMTYTFLGH